ncbi:hypothetical protein LCGC14_2511670, partial [marine sediment metagenome]
RWPDGVVVCPTCDRTDANFLEARRIWQCKSKHTKRQFSVKVGTIFEDSPISLDKWLVAVWMIANDKNGVSSYEIARAIGVTQKSAWFMMHRIRLALQTGDFHGMKGEVEVDETFIGGKARNMHKSKRQAIIKGRGTVAKTTVLGLMQRGDDNANSVVQAEIVPNTKRNTLSPAVRSHVVPGSTVYTDALSSYTGLDVDYIHQVIDHAEAYVHGKVHTNGIENFWSLLKRAIKGTYVSVEPFHLFRYLDEETFRFNNRKDNDAGRFHDAVKGVAGKRLTYRKLVGQTA